MQSAFSPPRLEKGVFPPKDPNTDVFEIYNREAKVYDTAMVERWRTAMEGILIFSGLFSAAVTAFIIESYKTLQPDPNDRTAELLNQISQQLAGLPIPVQSEISFSPSWTAVVTNILWFISLGSSLACAVAATLIQQWARNYIHSIERRPSAESRARMRMYLFEGVEKLGMSRLTDGIPALLHLSLFTFLMGLVFFIHGISIPVTAVAIAILVISALVYAIATVLPLIIHNSPIQTPLTSVVWHPAFIQSLDWVYAHAIYVVVKLSALSSKVAQPFIFITIAQPSIFANIARSFILAWTAIDLVVRQRFSFLYQIQSSSLATPTAYAGIELPEQLHDQTLEAIRANIARDVGHPSFWRREQTAIIWLAQFLDEDRELLPFLEALPSYLSRAFMSEPFLFLQRQISALLLHPTLNFQGRVELLRRNHSRNPRTVLASLNFLLLVPDDTLSSIFSTDLDRLTFYLPDNFSYQLYNPDVIVREVCLATVATVVWCQAAVQQTPSKNYPLDGLRQRLADQCTVFFNQWNSWTTKPQMEYWFSETCISRGLSLWIDSSIMLWQRLPYLATSQLYLKVIPRMTVANIDVVRYTLTRMHDHMNAFHDSPWSFSYLAFPEKDLFYCTVMELLVRLLDDCSEELLRSFETEVFRCMFALDRVLSHSSFTVLLRVLESDAWVKCPGLRYHFCYIVRSHLHKRGETCFPNSIMQKYWLLDVSHQATGIPTFDMSVAGPFVQRLFARTVVTRVPPTVFRAVIQQFYELHDPLALEEALIAMEAYRLSSSDESDEVVRCEEYLREVIRSKRRCEASVQADIRPEAAVQVG